LAADGPQNASGLTGADGAREGMLEWICEISNGQSVELTLAWEVSSPSGLNWGPQRTSALSELVTILISTNQPRFGVLYIHIWMHSKYNGSMLRLLGHFR
jgi:hypothetical protein